MRARGTGDGCGSSELCDAHTPIRADHCDGVVHSSELRRHESDERRRQCSATAAACGIHYGSISGRVLAPDPDAKTSGAGSVRAPMRRAPVRAKPTTASLSDKSVCPIVQRQLLRTTTSRRQRTRSIRRMHRPRGDAPVRRRNDHRPLLPLHAPRAMRRSTRPEWATLDLRVASPDAGPGHVRLGAGRTQRESRRVHQSIGVSRLRPRSRAGRSVMPFVNTATAPYLLR
jgi:hypothetical protein